MSGSLRREKGARTVLLRMAADEARAQRIRELKDQHPDLTWGYIAEQVGVRERSALQWAATGGISYDNAKRLARVFDADADWVWRGERGQTPDLSSNGRPEHRLDALEQRLADIEAKLDRQYVILGDILNAFATPEAQRAAALERISRAGRELAALGRERHRARSELREELDERDARPASG